MPRATETNLIKPRKGVTWVVARGDELQDPDIDPNDACDILQDAFGRPNIYKDDLTFLISALRRNIAWPLLLLGDPCLGKDVEEYEREVKRRKI